MTKKEIVLTIIFVIGGIYFLVVNQPEPRVVAKIDINKHQNKKVENVEEDEGRQRIMPAGMRSPVDKYFDPIGEMIDPYGIF